MTKKEIIEEKIKQLKAQARAIDSREAKKERAARTRHLIQIAAILSKSEDPAVKKVIAEAEKQIKAADGQAKKKVKQAPKQPDLI